MMMKLLKIYLTLISYKVQSKHLCITIGIIFNFSSSVLSLITRFNSYFHLYNFIGQTSACFLK